MDHTITAEISFFPLQSEDFKEAINQAIEIIRTFNVEYQVGPLSTTVKGEQAIIFKIAYKIFTSMGDAGKFVLNVKYSNI